MLVSVVGGFGSTAAADLGIRTAKGAGPHFFPHLPTASNLPETTGGGPISHLSCLL